MANYVTMGSAKQPDDTMDDDDDKDDTKRKSRNLSEKKRRDQFNMLVNELGSMVTTNNRKMDKSTVLKSTILFLKNHNEIALRSRVHEIQEDWKPSFLSNEEFTHLILEALDGFIIVFSSNGRIYYVSESVTSLLGYLPSELANATIYEIAYQDDQSYLYNVLLNPGDNRNQRGVKEENQVSFTCHIKKGGLDCREEDTYELVQFIGYFRSNIDMETLIPNNLIGNNVASDTKLVFVGTGRLQTPQLIRDMSFVDSTKSEFTSRHSLEWKFLFLDHRAPPIIGYLPFEVLGTSGYDYYHVDDLDKVVTCHESLMQKGEGTSCYYRFLTKGQQWIWLQTRFYIDYNQWNSKPEFIVCTHNVVSYTDVIKQLKKNINDCDDDRNSIVDQTTSKVHESPTAPGQVRSSAWSPKSSKPSQPIVTDSRVVYHGSKSAGSYSSRHSISTTHSLKIKAPPTSSTKFVPQLEATAKHHRQPEVDESRVNYVQPKTSVVPVNFPVPAASTVPISLPSLTVTNQHNIVMTTAQNQIQDELQRKHEELQQLIVHQQEELRRVSEQLLIARYGILSPLINVTLPYNINPSQPANQCCSSPNVEITRQAPTDPVQGLSVPPVSVALAMPIIPMETFRQPTTLLAGSDNNSQMIPQQHHHIQQNDQHQHSQHTQHLPQATHLEDHQIMSFQICPQNDIIYSNVDTAASAQQRQNRN